MSNLAKVVSRSAPLLGSVIGGPIGAGVGSIIGGIAALFGGDSDKLDDLAERIAADPNALLKLREFELSHAAQLEQIAADRVKSAHMREIEISKATGSRDWLMTVLALGIVAGFFGMCLLVAFTNMDNSDRDIFFMLLGTVASGFSCVLNFYFGSSFKPDFDRKTTDK